MRLLHHLETQISESDLRAALNRVVCESLQPVSTGLCALYAIFTVSHALWLPEVVATPMTLVAAGTAMGLLGFRVALSCCSVPNHWAHPLGAGIAGLILLNSLLHLSLLSEPQQTTNLMLLVIGAGSLFLSTRWLALVIAATLGGWGLVVWGVASSPTWMHFGFGLFSASVLAVLIHTVRVRTFRRLEGLHIQDQRQKRELEEAVQAAQQGEERYALATNAGQVGVWDWDIETNEIYLAPSLKAMLGFADHEIQNRFDDWHQQVHPDDRERVRAAADAHLAGVTPQYEVECRILHKDGSIRWFLSRGTALRDASGKPYRVLGSYADITERKRAEEARLRAELAEAANRELEKEIAERKRAEEQIRYRLALEEALAQASRLFVSTNEPDLRRLLQLLGETVGANRAYIFLLRDNGSKIDNTHEWCDENTAPQIDTLQNLNTSLIPWWMRKLERGETIVIPDVEALPADAGAEKEILQAQDIRSLLVVPIDAQGGGLLGFLGFDDTEKCRMWSEADSRILRVVSEMVSRYFARRQGEEALRESEERFRQLAENIREVFWMSDPKEHQLLYVSPAYEEVWGRSCRSLYEQPRSFLDAVHPEDRERARTTLAQQISGERTHVEYRIVQPDGSVRWIWDHGFPLKDKTGQVYRVVGIAEDITERKRIEEILREREERLEAIFRTASDIIATLDLEGVITRVNRAVELTLGYTPEELIGKLADSFFTLESAALARERTEKALKREPLPSLFELEAFHKNGTKVPLEGKASFLYEAEKPVGLVCVLRDVTLKKKLEQQRADFLAMLTHDIKNPLGVILVGTDLLLEEARERHLAGEENILQLLQRNALMVHSLATNYLDLAQIEVGHLTLTCSAVDLNSVLRHAGQQYETEARRRDLILHMNLGANLPTIEGDSLALERVFANLLHNAVKFTPEHGEVIVSATQLNEEVVVTVADTGPGIAPEEVPLLFDKYRKTKQGEARHGTGLGLFIAKTIVEAHGGRIEVRSVPGQGACFCVFLPLASLSSRAAL